MNVLKEQEELLENIKQKLKSKDVNEIKFTDYRLANALLEKETLDLQAIINILGERPFAPKSNFKAYLEYKRMHDHDEKKPEDKNEGDDNNEGKNENKKPQEQVA